MSDKSIFAPMLDYDYIYLEFRNGNLHPLYRYVYPGLIRYASRLLGERLSFMAEDCVQDSIMKLYINRNQAETMDCWRAWLLTSIRNRTVDMQRKASNGQLYVDESIRDKDNIRRELQLAIIEQEVLDAIYAAVKSLPEKYRAIFELSFTRQLKNREIADLLNVSEITVKKQKSRLIELLRLKLGNNINEHYFLIVMASSAID